MPGAAENIKKGSIIAKSIDDKSITWEKHFGNKVLAEIFNADENTLHEY
jgi:hypothetical protein